MLHVKVIAGAVSLTDQVVEAVRDAIHAGELRPGELYSVYQLADRLQTSRTPVREALLRLAEARMIQFERNRGFRVLRRDAREIAEIFQLRLFLEVPAAQIAATRADEALLTALRAELDQMRSAAADRDEARFMSHDRRFHDRVLGGGGNATLVGIVGNLRESLTTLGATTVDTSRSLHDVADEHRPILDALVARSPERAAAAVRSHLAHTARLLLAQVGAEPSDVDWLAAL
jgi:DNA-binding GntR family transcriptional regulator